MLSYALFFKYSGYQEESFWRYQFPLGEISSDLSIGNDDPTEGITLELVGISTSNQPGWVEGANGGRTYRGVNGLDIYSIVTVGRC